jgi:O-antigen ligase
VRAKIESWWLSQKNNPSIFFFYLLILFLPLQVGKHFWPKQAFIYGFRIDYLSPTFYFTDLLILIVITITLFQMKSYNNLLKNLKSKTSVFIIFVIAFLLISSLFAKNQYAAIYGIIKFLEFLFLAIFIVKRVKSFKFIYPLMSAAVIYESIIAIAQFINQGSLGNFFYFLGERTFTGQTPGIANASLGGELILRAYGTFPHPNVLAGFLTIYMLVILVNMLKEKRLSIIYWMSLVFGTVALFLTLSRVAIALWAFFVFIILITKNRLSKKNTALLFVLTISMFSLSPFYLRFTNLALNDQSLYIRGFLMDTAIKIFYKSPVLGVGLNNFIVNLPDVVNITNISFFQPVHNIYLLILSETGLLGFLSFSLFIYSILKKVNKKSPFFLSFVLVLILGLFDHYLLTLQQGQILFSLTLGFCWAKIIK